MELLSKTNPIVSEEVILAFSKVTAVPKLILLSDESTVPTIALPISEAAPSTYATTTLLLLESTVPTIAVPKLPFPPSL